jgi:hypothetical protein
MAPPSVMMPIIVVVAATTASLGRSMAVLSVGLATALARTRRRRSIFLNRLVVPLHFGALFYYRLFGLYPVCLFTALLFYVIFIAMPSARSRLFGSWLTIVSLVLSV